MTYKNPFGDVDNKDLAGTDLENKTADQGVPDVDPEEEAEVAVAAIEFAEQPVYVDVEFRHHHTYGGVEILPGETHSLPAAEAAALISNHRAVLG